MVKNQTMKKTVCLK